MLGAAAGGYEPFSSDASLSARCTRGGSWLRVWSLLIPDEPGVSHAHAQKPLVFPSAERRQASKLARLVRLGVSALTGAASGSQVGSVQPAQPESVGLDCAPVGHGGSGVVRPPG